MLLAVMVMSCSPKGYDFRSGSKEGVRFKKSVTPRTVVVIGVCAFMVLSVNEMNRE